MGVAAGCCWLRTCKHVLVNGLSKRFGLTANKQHKITRIYV